MPGYIGQTSYDPIIAGIHIFTHTFGFPMMVYLFLVLDQKYIIIHLQNNILRYFNKFKYLFCLGFWDFKNYVC